MIGWLHRSLVQRVADRRAPDFVVTGPEGVYLYRWWLIPRNRFLNVYLHLFMRSDEDRALHDHPWPWCSILLDGEYTEVSRPLPGSPLLQRWETFRAGSIRFHRATFAHRLVLRPDRKCWTLFITGPRIRNWGFHCPKGWVRWEDFTDTSDGISITGKGCGE